MNEPKTIDCPHCKETVKKGASVCPHCKRAIFSADPSTNAVLGFISFIVLFFLLWQGVNWLGQHQANQLMRDIQNQSK